MKEIKKLSYLIGGLVLLLAAFWIFPEYCFHNQYPTAIAAAGSIILMLAGIATMNEADNV